MSFPTTEQIQEFFDQCYHELGKKFRLKEDDLANKPQLKLMSLEETLKQIEDQFIPIKRFRKKTELDRDFEDLLLTKLKIMPPEYDRKDHSINMSYPFELAEKGKEDRIYQMFDGFDFSKNKMFRVVAGEIGHALRAITRKYAFTERDPDFLGLNLENLELIDAEEVMKEHLKWVRGEKKFPTSVYVRISELFEASAKILSHNFFKNTAFAHDRPKLQDCSATISYILKSKSKIRYHLLSNFFNHLPSYIGRYIYEQDKHFKELIEKSKPPLIYQSAEDIYYKVLRNYTLPVMETLFKGIRE